VAKGVNRAFDLEALAKTLRAVAHPARISALLAISEGQLSPVELTRRSDQDKWSLGVVAYHVRALAGAGLIELASTVQRRGAVEHRYSVTPRGRALSDAIRRLSR
jgi:DNA-binding transcriptional ArsR family regulator